jgi:hypothetical protein
MQAQALKKKPFKETKLGQFLAVKAPHILNQVGNLLPDQGLLGVVKNIVMSDPAIKPEDRLQYEKMNRDFELELIRIEQQDRSSARVRETEFVKATGHVDWMMYFVCIIGLAAFSFILYVLVYNSIPDANRDLFIHAIGMVEGVAVSIFSYYFGSSKGSAEKTKLLQQ